MDDGAAAEMSWVVRTLASGKDILAAQEWEKSHNLPLGFLRTEAVAFLRAKKKRRTGQLVFIVSWFIHLVVVHEIWGVRGLSWNSPTFLVVSGVFLVLITFCAWLMRLSVPATLDQFLKDECRLSRA